MAFLSDKDIVNLITNAEEKNTKESGEDTPTMNLGSMMNIYNDIVKDSVIQSSADTVAHMDWLAYCELIETFGFGLMMEDYSPDGGKFLRIYYHEKDGLLLVATSSGGNRQAARVYYNWKPNVLPQEEWEDADVADFVNYWEAVSSGGFFYPGHERHEIPENVLDPAWDNIVWAGEHDARENLSFKLKRLREYGTFIPKWTEQPYVWLVGYWEQSGDVGEEDTIDYNDIIKNRILRLPKWVQDNIKGQ